MVRRFVHFGVLFIEDYQYSEKTCHLYGEKLPGRAKDICLHKGCQLREFST
jgi:hypothetical protein